jgi:hypothetical protein
MLWSPLHRRHQRAQREDPPQPRDSRYAKSVWGRVRGSAYESKDLTFSHGVHQ